MNFSIKKVVLLSAINKLEKWGLERFEQICLNLTTNPVELWENIPSLAHDLDNYAPLSPEDWSPTDNWRFT